MISITLFDLPGAMALSSVRDTPTPLEPYSGFNTCDYTGDSDAHVAACRRELAAAMGTDPSRLVMPRQTHSLNVATIATGAESIDNTDALVSATPGIVLAIHTADCVPVALYDPVAGVIGAAHSGWRGTAGAIAAKTVGAMKSLGADPARIIAALGPCICGKCYETGPEVADLFPGHTFIDAATSRPHVDLPGAVAATLISCGIPPDNIAKPGACSRCDSSRFFSARRLGIASGRTVTAVMLRH